MKNFVFVFMAFFLFTYSQLYAENKTMQTLYDDLCKLSIHDLNKIGDKYSKSGTMDSSLICYSIIFDKYNKKLPDSELEIIAEAYNSAGIIYYNHYNYTKALELFIKGLNISESINYDKCIARIYNNIGNVYFAFEEYNNALEYYKKSYNKNRKSSVLNNIIITYCAMQKYDSVRTYMSDVRKYGNDSLSQTVLNSLGIISGDAGKYDSAFYYFKRSLKAVDSHDKFKCFALSNIAKVHLTMKQYDSAFYYINLSKNIAEKKELLDILAENCMALSELYDIQGDYKKSLYYKNRHQQIYDSIFNVKEYAKIKEMESIYEMEKIDKQISLLNAEKKIRDNQIKVQKIILLTITLFSVIILIFFVTVYLQKRKLSQAYKDLFVKNIEVINSEKYNRELRMEYESAQSESDPSNQKIKYSSSSLNEDAKSALIKAVNNIAENTEEFFNPDFSIEKLAILVNSKTKYISQIINENYNQNFSMFVNEYRIKKARLLLTDSEYRNYTIEAIAMKVGFKTMANFHPIFKKFTGITPSQYQKMAHKNSVSR